MVIYACEKCGKTFKQKGHWDEHVNKRKKPCKLDDNESLNKNENTMADAISDNIPQKSSFISSKLPQTENNSSILPQKENVIKKMYICQFCKKGYGRKDNLERHISFYCKDKANEILPIEEKANDILQKKIAELEKENQNLKNENHELKGQLAITNNNTQNNCTNNNTTNNTTNNVQNIQNIQNNKIEIKILAFGKEELDHLRDADFMRALNKGHLSVPEMVELIHYNNKAPQNHNVYISNWRDNTAEVYTGKVWEKRDATEVIDEIYNDNLGRLDDKRDELENELDELIKTKYDRFRNDQQDDKIARKAKKATRLRTYNKRKIPIKTRKLEKTGNIDLLNN